jgi:hypothetical protein
VRRICLFVVTSLLLVTACSNSASSTTTTVNEESVISALRMKTYATLNTLLQPPIVGWNCDVEDPTYQALPSLTRIDAFGENCVWKVGSDTVRATLSCFVTARPCKMEEWLLKLVDSTGAFTSSDVAKMMESRSMDGLQSTDDGATSWSVGPQRYLDIIIDIPALQKRLTTPGS